MNYRRGFIGPVFVIIIAILVIGVVIYGYGQSKHSSQTDTTTTSVASSTTSTETENSITYTNTQYGFNFTLPSSWKGYSIVTDVWKGSSSDSALVTQGPLISIRHPEWTAQNPRQDIPIMVFTIAQWNSLQQGDFYVSAAPIGPSELGRNATYVFALPARYNYAFPTGYEEVQTIMSSHPLQAF